MHRYKPKHFSMTVFELNSLVEKLPAIQAEAKDIQSSIIDPGPEKDSSSDEDEVLNNLPEKKKAQVKYLH